MTHATEKSYGLSLYTRLAIYEGVSAESPLDETEISYSRRNIKVKLVLWKYFHGWLNEERRCNKKNEVD